MKKSWRCKIGWHDWEIIENKGIPDLEERVQARIEKRWENTIIWWGYNYLIKKVCLKCGKVIDQITPFEKKVEEKYYQKEMRQHLAQILFKEGRNE